MRRSLENADNCLPILGGSGAVFGIGNGRCSHLPPQHSGQPGRACMQQGDTAAPCLLSSCAARIEWPNRVLGVGSAPEAPCSRGCPAWPHAIASDSDGVADLLTMADQESPARPIRAEPLSAPLQPARVRFGQPKREGPGPQKGVRPRSRVGVTSALGSHRRGVWIRVGWKARTEVNLRPEVRVRGQSPPGTRTEDPD